MTSFFFLCPIKKLTEKNPQDIYIHIFKSWSSNLAIIFLFIFFSVKTKERCLTYITKSLWSSETCHIVGRTLLWISDELLKNCRICGTHLNRHEVLMGFWLLLTVIFWVWLVDHPCSQTLSTCGIPQVSCLTSFSNHWASVCYCYRSP